MRCDSVWVVNFDAFVFCSLVFSKCIGLGLRFYDQYHTLMNKICWILRSALSIAYRLFYFIWIHFDGFNRAWKLLEKCTILHTVIADFLSPIHLHQSLAIPPSHGRKICHRSRLFGGAAWTWKRSPWGDALRAGCLHISQKLPSIGVCLLDLSKTEWRCQHRRVLPVSDSVPLYSRARWTLLEARFHLWLWNLQNAQGKFMCPSSQTGSRVGSCRIHNQHFCSNVIRSWFSRKTSQTPYWFI